MAQHEEIVYRIRYPRHIRRNSPVRPYSFHEAMGVFILNVILFFLILFLLYFFVFSLS